MYFVRKAHAFLLLHAHFDVCYYLMDLCHFGKMNDKMMFFSFHLINILVIIMLLDY